MYDLFIKVYKKLSNVIYTIKIKTKFSKSIIFGKYTLIYGSKFVGKAKLGSNSIFVDSSLGYGSYFGNNCRLSNTRIENFTSIGSNVTVINTTHPTQKFVSTSPVFFSVLKQASFSYVKKQKFQEQIYIDKNEKVSVFIGNDVWIGENVTILGGIKINDGAIIGANSLVTKDVPSYAIVGGIPAKIIRYRFNDGDIDFLKKIEWWNKDEKWIKRHADYFEDIELLKSKMFYQIMGE